MLTELERVEAFCTALTKLCRDHRIDLDTDREGNLYAQPCDLSGISGDFAIDDPKDFIIRWK